MASFRRAKKTNKSDRFWALVLAIVLHNLSKVNWKIEMLPVAHPLLDMF